MGGTIGKPAGKSFIDPVSRDRKDAKAMPPAALRRPDQESSPGPSLGQRKPTQPRKAGEIVAGVAQVHSNMPESDLEDNVNRLRAHANKLAPDELTDVARELAESIPMPQGISQGDRHLITPPGVDLLARHLRGSAGSFTPEQLKAFGRGLGLVDGGQWLRVYHNPSWSRPSVFAQGIPDFGRAAGMFSEGIHAERNAQYLVAGG